MDLFSIIGTMWRHRLVTIPVIVITLLGAFYVIEIKAPTYQATADILLGVPPGPPTAAQIAANPALGKINTYNPYISYGNLVLVADVVIDIADSATTQQAVVSQGANPKYALDLAPLVDNPPVIEVTDEGGSAAAAIQSTQIVAEAVQKDLYQAQAQANVNPKYMITSSEIVKPLEATTSASSRLRDLLGFLAIGLILLLVAVSIAQANENRKHGRAANRPGVPKPALSDAVTRGENFRAIDEAQRPATPQGYDRPPRDAVAKNHSRWYR
jgi:hypothetical protein